MNTTTERRVRVAMRPAVLGVLAATAAAVLVRVAANGAGADFRVGFGDGQPMTVSAPLVALTALLASLAGWGLLAIMVRTTARARWMWTLVAALAALLSLAGPLTATASAGTKVGLAGMHVVVAAVLIPVLSRAAERPREPS